jgi:hypothetical protein
MADEWLEEEQRRRRRRRAARRARLGRGVRWRRCFELYIFCEVRAHADELASSPAAAHIAAQRDPISPISGVDGSW